MQASVKLEERMARLVLIRDEDDLVAHKLRNVTTIGRASLNHIVIDDPAVSAQHAIIARSADSYPLQDNLHEQAIYYRVEADVVCVRAILDCRRNPSWIRRRVRGR